MVLTKVEEGHFKGLKGATATIRLAMRSAGIGFQVISAVYGPTTLAIKANGDVDVPLGVGEKPLTLVYAATQSGAWLDLWEVDATGKVKLMPTAFNVVRPTVSIWLEGV